MTYTPTNWSNIQNFTSFINIANDQTGGWFFSGINILIFFVSLLSLINFGFESAVLTAAFVSFIIATLLVFMGLGSIWVAGVFLGIMLLMFALIRWGDKYN